MITVDRMIQVLDSVNDLPTLPSIYTQITEVIKDPNSSVADVAKIIERDQSLTSKVLRLVNSSFYGFARQISTIRQAVVLLGFNNIKNTVLSVSVFQTFAGMSLGRFDMRDFWKHSIATGVLATFLDKRLRKGYQEETFVAGLLHDIGKIILNRYFGDMFEEALQYAQSKKETFYRAERAVIGFSHDEIGEYLAEKWQLPYTLVESIALHHQPSNLRSNPTLVAIVHLANVLAHELHFGFSGDFKVPDVDSFAYEELGIQKEELEEIKEEARKVLEDSHGLLSIIE
jgi:putative nucleotidyltransferase with HDIG domain